MKDRWIWFWGFVICAWAQLADLLTSLRLPKGFVETNPYTRYPNGQFCFIRGLADKALGLIVFGLFSLGVYWLFSKIDARIGLILSLAILFVFAFLAWEAAAHNLLIHTGWYVNLP